MTDSTESPGRTVIDFSAHLFPERVFPTAVYAEANRRGSSFVPLLRDPDVFVDRLTAAGIDFGVLSQPYYMGHSDAEQVATANDALLEVIDWYDMFYGLAAIPVAAGGETAATELQRCLDEGYHGGAIETKSDGIELNDASLDPVFEVAVQREAPLLVHPKLQGSLHEEVLDDRYGLNAVFGREAALSESICKVIHDGVLDRYPDLNLVYHHLGGNIASMFGRLHNHLIEGRWPMYQERTKPYSEFKHQFESRIYVDTSGYFGYDAPIRAALEEFSASQIVFGTDFPYEPRSVEDLERYRRPIETLCSVEEADRILGGTAANLLINTG